MNTNEGKPKQDEPQRDDEYYERLLDEIRWYGKTIAGGGPMIDNGYSIAAKKAEEHWYVVTLPLLYELNAVHGPKNRIGCIRCHGQGVKASKPCKTCKGTGMVETTND